MKKILCLTIIFSTLSFCYANEQVNPDTNLKQNEIHLNINSRAKEYNLKKNDYKNNPENTKIEVDETPFELITSPLQFLKQYQGTDF